MIIYDSLTKQKREFKPLEDNKVKMYVCGMTVYDLCHLGHARTQVAFDIIYRYLSYKGYDVNYVRNITDIDDKIIKRANEKQIEISKLTAENIDYMHEDLSQLFIADPSCEPKATDNIENIVSMIADLIVKNSAYVGKNGDVFYSVESFADYGKLSGQKLDSLQVGIRVEENDAKNNPHDFVLWKLAKEGEPAWDSPWGAGRPGWHIECSAMARDLLGDSIDIHGGGFDLRFPHHENEIAQTEAVTNKPFVNFWMHAGFLNIKDEKMSKSLGNFLSIRDAVKIFDSEVLRFFLSSYHYRSEVNYSESNIKKAQESLNTLYISLRDFDIDFSDDSELEQSFIDKFEQAMDDDFNTPEAFAVLFELAHEINKTKSSILANTLYYLASILGLLQYDPEEYFKNSYHDSGLSNEEVDSLLQQRVAARKDKNWQLADEIRDKLTENNIILEDDASGTRWRRG